MTTTITYTNLDYLHLMADGDADMEKVMLGMLLTELPAEFQKMKHLCAAGEWEELSRVSHKMKSTLAFVGNDEMTEANKAIESSAKNAEYLEDVSDHIATMERFMQPVMQELEAALSL
ncbi:MAG: Hpt domain-containing protein [Saprospiraceae bacterium]|nr:MAG: Hpt domain-containing protein [Saprospiraceae bacterium]